ncbi:NAD-dependent epimerase/dehydratase family protein [Priestia endophytica]|uniref:NAD-dependent epimerase/dehydratase family protein n=1 Tax=Priestia endophytica TaxID=135735 RepID=UPI002041E31C|nr:NAD-dependent epimerase/dehydratase family protein [Priestia endophytica]MCM3538704.1 NAD-dependent epimerase/dehydratase family protein [Priestia endophytica]
MDILILGGTRFLGRFLVDAAREKGHHVTLFNRGNNNDIFPGIEQLKGDRDSDLHALRGRKWDAAIDTSGFIPRTVLKSCELLSHVNHYTYISSISVYKDPSKPGLDEQAELHSMDHKEVEKITHGTAGPIYGEYYGPLKSLSEKAAKKELGEKVLIIRAGQIVGPYDYTDRLPYWVKRISEGGEILSPGRPDRPVQFIDVKDLARWIIQLIEQNIMGTFNAVGPDRTLTMEQLLEECKKVSKSDATFTWVTEKFLLNNNVEAWREMPLWLPEEYPLPGAPKPWNGFLAVNNKKAINRGLTFCSLSETLKSILEWERNRLKEDERKAGMDRQRENHLLKLWHESSK